MDRQKIREAVKKTLDGWPQTAPIHGSLTLDLVTAIMKVVEAARPAVTKSELAKVWVMPSGGHAALFTLLRSNGIGVIDG